MKPFRVQTVAFIIGMLFISHGLFAASHYVRVGSTGNASGSDWANACPEFVGACAVATMVRGDIYYVAGGRYGTHTWSTPTQGALSITIKGATAADHGTNVGWQSIYGVDVTRALWKGYGDTQTYPYAGQVITTGYWVFDGNYIGISSDPSTYGFQMSVPSPCADFTNIYIGNSSGQVYSGIQIKSVASQACSGSYGKTFISQHTQGSGSNMLISHVYCSGMQGCVRLGNNDGHNDQSIVEYVYSVDGFSDSSHHGEQINMFELTNFTLRYGTFINGTGTGTVIANDPSTITGIGCNYCAFYGNTFVGGNGGNGVISSTSASSISNSVVYNNTFVGASVGPWFSGCPVGGRQCGQSTGNIAMNNLVSQMPCALSGGSSIVHDYNSYRSCTDVAPSELNGEIKSIVSFMNTATGNYQLAAATATGKLLSAPFTQDPSGETRGNDGIWDRGAWEYKASTQTSTQPPPSVLTFVQ